MKAIVCTKYGGPDVLQLKEVEKPIIKDDEVLIKVRASSINSLEHRTMRAKPFFIRFMGEGVLRPKKIIPGADMAGDVVQVGQNVTQFKVGDVVFGDVYMSKSGAFAQYVCVKESATMVSKPKGVTYEQAGSLPVAGTTALQALVNHGNIKEGQDVLINGASGGVGTYAVILAKALGAQVTGVCSTKNLQLVKSIGADEVVDYQVQDVTKLNKRYDLIIDVAGTMDAKGYINALKPKGIGVLVGFSSLMQMLKIMLQSKGVERKHGCKVISMGITQQSREDLAYLAEMVETGAIKPVIEKVYPLAETAQAMRYFDEEHASAKVVISVE